MGKNPENLRFSWLLDSGWCSPKRKASKQQSHKQGAVEAKYVEAFSQRFRMHPLQEEVSRFWRLLYLSPFIIYALRQLHGFSPQYDLPITSVERTLLKAHADGTDIWKSFPVWAPLWSGKRARLKVLRQALRGRSWKANKKR